MNIIKTGGGKVRRDERSNDGICISGVKFPGVSTRKLIDVFIQNNSNFKAALDHVSYTCHRGAKYSNFMM
jgi:hypothetical protein